MRVVESDWVGLLGAVVVEARRRKKMVRESSRILRENMTIQETSIGIMRIWLVSMWTGVGVLWEEVQDHGLLQRVHLGEGLPGVGGGGGEVPGGERKKG